MYSIGFLLQNAAQPNEKFLQNRTHQPADTHPTTHKEGGVRFYPPAELGTVFGPTRQRCTPSAKVANRTPPVLFPAAGRCDESDFISALVVTRESGFSSAAGERRGRDAAPARNARRDAASPHKTPTWAKRRSGCVCATGRHTLYRSRHLRGNPSLIAAEIIEDSTGFSEHGGTQGLSQARGSARLGDQRSEFRTVNQSSNCQILELFLELVLRHYVILSLCV